MRHGIRVGWVGRESLKGHSYRRDTKKQTAQKKLSELFELFIEARQRPSDPKPLSPKTVRSYRQAHKFFSAALAGPLDKARLLSAIQTLVDEKLKSAQMSSTGINVYIRSLNSFLSWCNQLRLINERLKVNLVRVERRQHPHTLNQEQVSTWTTFESATVPEFRVISMVSLVLDAGLRIEEAMSLSVGDIDWKGHRIWISKGKGGKNRHAPLSEEGERMLRRYLAATTQYRGDNATHSSFLFSTISGAKLNYRNMLRDLKAVAKRLGMEWVGWHTFRRTFATLYLRNGGYLHDLQQILGHSDIRTTLLYLGNSIEEIVAIHDQHSPLNAASHTHKRKQKRHNDIKRSQPLVSTLTSRLRQG
jgi:integrase/recombinase XerD